MIRLCVVISVAAAVVLGAALFSGHPGPWRFVMELGFLASIGVFLALLVGLLAQRLQAYSDAAPPREAARADQARTMHNR